MMLNAVNRMAPSLSSAMRQVGQLKQQLQNIPKSITSTVKIKRIEETVKSLRETSSKANTKAVQDGAIGTAIMAPVAKTVKDFAQAEDSFTSLKISAYDASIPTVKMQEELKKATIEAQRLGDMTRFSTREAYEGMTTLVKGGADLKDVYSGLGQASLYLAQAGGVDVTQSAEAMVKISNAYQLSGEQMKNVADMISRVDGASTASIGSLQAGFKYSSGAAAQIKQPVQETAQALSVLNNRGLDGETAGTNYADMLQRLIPQTKQQTAYMKNLGWIQEDGHSVFFNDDKVKNMPEILNIMRNSLKGMRPDDQLKYLHKIFGEQGGRAAMALMQEGKGSWEEVGGNISKAMPLNDRIGMQSKTLAGRFENMMGSVQNLSADSGSPIGTFLSERLEGITEIINATRAWAEANPEVVKGIMWIVTSLGMLKIGSMVFHFMKAGVFSLAGDFMALVGWLSKCARHAHGLYDSFKYFRKGGGKFFESIWKGAQFAYPWLGKIARFGGKIGKAFGGGAMKAIGWFAKLGKYVGMFAGKWLIHAARIGAGWLIAMGPIGWIILGVTALIAASVWVWENNFMGFRDKCISVWNAIENWGGKTWNKITGFVKDSIGWISNYIEKIKDALGLSEKLNNKEPSANFQGISLRTPDVPFLNPDSGKNITSNVNQTNNVTVASTNEAADFVGRVEVPKYKGSDYNPLSNGNFAW